MLCYQDYWQPVIILTFFTTIVMLQVRDTDDLTAFYNTHAVVLNGLKRGDEAVSYWKRSSDMQQGYVVLYSRIDKTSAQEESQKLRYIRSFYDLM